MSKWLSATWPRVRSQLPTAPARVVEIGCGPAGGFVPLLLECGYEALGVDPEAPDGARYERVEFERLEPPHPFDAAIACTSLHHVRDPGEVLDRLTGMLTKGGVFVVVEWDWTKFDEATALWCFERLGSDDSNWLRRHRHQWQASKQEWQRYLRAWAAEEALHGGEKLLHILDERFEERFSAEGPYFFADLADTTEADEQAAIDAGVIQATRIDWVGAMRVPARPNPRTAR
jgi:SAM-dependent methyltransferase